MRLSCTLFPYSLSKDSSVCRSFSFCFLYFLYVFPFILCITSVPNDRAHAILAELDLTVKPTPLTERVTDVVAALKLTTASTDSNIVLRVIYFLFFFLDLWFSSLKLLFISLLLPNDLLKLVTTKIFFLNLCSKSWSQPTNGAEGFSSAVICLI